MSIPPTALPEFLRGARIICPASEEIERIRATHHEADTRTSVAEEVDLSPGSSNMFFDVVSRDAYRNNDWSTIKRLEKEQERDLVPVYNNIHLKGDAAWVLMETLDTHKPFFVSFSNKASIFVIADDTQTETRDGNTSFVATVITGVYSTSSGVLGVTSYKVSSASKLVEQFLLLAVSSAVGSMIKSGLKNLVSRFASTLSTKLSSLSKKNFVFKYAKKAIGGLAKNVIAMLVFSGIKMLWDYMNRTYTIETQIYNWDSNTWNSGEIALDNAQIVGKEEGEEVSFVLDKFTPAGSVITPPGITPARPLVAVCRYATIVWENDNKFLEGCDMAMQMYNDNGGGFTWGFSCPRFGENKQKAVGQVINAAAYLKNESWNPNPTNFTIQSGGVPVSFTLDALEGAKDNIYNIIINIGNER